MNTLSGVARTIPTAVALVALSACQTVSEFTTDTPTFAGRTAQPPAAAAVCITRNIERRASNIITDRRSLGQSGVELVARVTGNVTTNSAVAHLQPEGSGSTVKLWLAPHMFQSSERIAGALLEGC